MSSLLYNKPECPFCWKSRLVAAFSNIEIDLVDIDTKNKPDYFLALNPAGTVPVLDDSGTIVCGSDEIIRYWSTQYKRFVELDLDSSEVTQWHNFANQVLGDGTKQWVFQHRDRPEEAVDRALMAQCKSIWVQCLAYIETQLGPQEWLLGSHPSLADCAVFPRVALGLRYGLPGLDDYPKLKYWYQRIEESEVGMRASAWGKAFTNQ